MQVVVQVALLLRSASKFFTPFDFRDHGYESQDAQMCKLQEVWATSKGPPCEILHALFCGQRKAERQRFIWELKRQSRERGELERQSRERGELKRQSRERGEFKRMWQFKPRGEPMRNLQCKKRGELKRKGQSMKRWNRVVRTST